MASTEPSSPRSWRHDVTAYLIFVVLIATIGPLQYGYHLAELNAPQAVITCEKKSVSAAFLSRPRLPQCIPMTSAQFGLVSSLYTPGGLLGALSAGPLATKYGRLLTMRVTTTFFILGPVLEALAPSIVILTIGRFLSGIGAGAAIVVVPIYIAEIAPPTAKGTFGALTQIMINVGVLITQGLGYFMSKGSLWRIILAIAGGIGLFQLVALSVVPESPKWLVDRGRAPQARRIVQRIRGADADVEEEVEGWGTNEGAGTTSEEEERLLNARNADNRPLAKGPSPNKKGVGILEIVFHPHHQRAILAVVGVMFAQQLCGINSIIMYSVALLSNLLPTTATLLAVGVSVVNLVATIVFSPLTDKWGRKPCLLLSIAGMGVNSALLACGILFSVKALSATATVLFVTFFAIGLGPVPFILASELVGPEAVGATQSWALAANWISTFIVAQFFPILNEWLGKGRVYFVFAALAVLFFVFVALFVPETKGKRDADEVWGRDRRED